MKRKLIVLLLGVSFFLVMCSCGNDVQESYKGPRKGGIFEWPAWYAVLPISADNLYAVGYGRKTVILNARNFAVSRAHNGFDNKNFQYFQGFHRSRYLQCK